MFSECQHVKACNMTCKGEIHLDSMWVHTLMSVNMVECYFVHYSVFAQIYGLKLLLLEKENVCGDTGHYTAWETLYFLNYLFIYCST